jgi:hypothetical protein
MKKQLFYKPSTAPLSSAPCDWHTGRRRRDASHDVWVKVAEGVPGTSYSCPFPTGGVYRVKAEMVLAGERQEAFYKIHSRGPLDPKGHHYMEGGHNHIGVTSESWQMTLRYAALAKLNNTEYAESAFLPPRHGFIYCPRDKPKCNFFVAHVAEEAGVGVPGTHGGNPLLPYPPLANDWATGAIPIPGWTHLTTEYPEPGWIVGHPSSSGSGHCGIVDYDGFAIAAGKFQINRAYWQFLDGTCGYNKKTE